MVIWLGNRTKKFDYFAPAGGSQKLGKWEIFTTHFESCTALPGVGETLWAEAG
jgi:hypothetical protein